MEMLFELAVVGLIGCLVAAIADLAYWNKPEVPSVKFKFD